MKKLIYLFSVLFCFLCAMPMASASRVIDFSGEAVPVVAVVPYIDASASITDKDKKAYIAETIKEGYTDHFAAAGMKTVSYEKMKEVLDSVGVNLQDKVLPEESQMAAIARAAGADYVIAMIVNDIQGSREEGLYHIETAVKTDLEYAIYSKKTGALVTFKSDEDHLNKSETQFGDVGYKHPIVKSLKRSMERANVKIERCMSEH